MVQNTETIVAEYLRRLDDLVTTLDELHELDVPRLNVEQIEEGDTWRTSSHPAAKEWRNVFEIVDTHIGGAPELIALDTQIPTHGLERDWVVQMSAPQWLDDYVGISVAYHPEGELSVFSTLYLRGGSEGMIGAKFYDGRLSALLPNELEKLRFTACLLGPHVENW